MVSCDFPVGNNLPVLAPMKSRKIRWLDTSSWQIDWRKTVLLWSIEYATSQKIDSYSNADNSIIWNLKVENTIYKFKGQTCGDSLCSAWTNYMKVKKELWLSSWCNDTIDIEFVDFCDKTYTDTVKIRKPITTNQEEFCNIIDFEFELISDHKWYKWDSWTTCMNQWYICGNNLCNTFIDNCGNCKSIFGIWWSKIIQYTWNIPTTPIITIKGNMKNPNIYNATNNTRLWFTWDFTDIYINNTDVNNRVMTNNWWNIYRTKWWWIILDQWENEIVVFDDTGNLLDICITRNEKFM